MAQLRDKHTSELIAEGSPVEMVLLADQLGRDEVLFDGVGLQFDPDAVLAAHQQNVEGIRAAAADPNIEFVTEEDVKKLTDLQDTAVGKVSDAVDVMMQARKRASSA